MPERPPESSKRRKRWWARILQGVLVMIVLLAGFGTYEAVTWPDVAALARENPTTTAFIEDYRQRDRARGGSGEVAWRWVPYERISPQLKQAVLVAEDINFHSHKGFEWEEMRRAIEDTREEGKPLRGASTLTQQLAKNLWLSPSRNPWRKVKEALLTMQLERHLDKRRILELYLNVAELGPGIYGAEAAARHYFGKPAADLTPREAAALAASLPHPSTWHPGSDSSTYRRRVDRIARRMARAEWIFNLL